MYLTWDNQKLTNFSPQEITNAYNQGYVFGRTEKGEMFQTRSVRIDVKNDFSLNSENRRILRKTEELEFSALSLPDPTYDWTIGKLAKDFYDTKFGKGTFSANKAKILFTDEKNSNFNTQLVFRLNGKIIGYALCYENDEILHYSYPFYDLQVAKDNKNIGMGMMVRSVQYAAETGKRYLYLGSAQRPGDTYKFQFNNMEWFDGKVWTDDVEELKKK